MGHSTKQGQQTTPERALERMKELTRRIAAVPKAEAVKPKPKGRQKQGGVHG